MRRRGALIDGPNQSKNESMTTVFVEQLWLYKVRLKRYVTCQETRSSVSETASTLTDIGGPEGTGKYKVSSDSYKP